MAELTPKERLQPSLLDRLTDHQPERRQESRDERVLSMSKLRKCVLRDLAWLLNATALSARQDTAEHPHAASSVLNYGLPPLAGNTAHSLDVLALERILRQIIWDFEPRILRNTVKVRAALSEEKMNHNTLAFTIEGELWAQPMPIQLFLKTEFDLEGGQVTVEDLSAAGPVYGPTTA